MKFIIFKYFLVIICGLILTACDLSTSPGNRSKAKSNWQCTKIISQNKILCIKGKQSVTIVLDYLIVPGAVDSSTRKIIFEQSFCTSNYYENCSTEALQCIKELILNQTVKLVPEPSPDIKKVTAQVFTSRGTDIAVTLLKEGLAIVKKENSPESYFAYQRQAINFERGLWKNNKIYNEIFTVETAFDITIDEDRKKRSAKVIKGLRRFHSPDLIRAPLIRDADTSKEKKSMVITRCKANIKIKINLPPKEYELSVLFRPLTRANIYSGPLVSFKEKEMDWKEKYIEAKGGDFVDVKLEYKDLYLSLVMRGTQKVYSGYIVEGYEIEIISNEETIFRKTEKISDKEILGKLEPSEKNFF
jgi:hypothetical protein